MSQNTLDEREFELINILGPKIGSSQRDLSRHMDLSLGMTNMLIRRLAAKGFIRIRQLNKKKVEYILTPKGFSEKMRKSVKYTMKTIRSIGLINDRVTEIVQELYTNNHREFYILGESDLVILVESILQNAVFAQAKVQRLQEIPSGLQGVVFICTEKFDQTALKGIRAVNLIEELARGQVFVVDDNDQPQELGPLALEQG